MDQQVVKQDLTWKYYDYIAKRTLLPTVAQQRRDIPIMSEEIRLLELPVLGLPFELGTLYNANKNQIVPAMPLWEKTNANVHVRRNITHNTEVTTTDSLVSKMKSLDIKGNFVISALSNKLEVKGSGAVLKDNKSSKIQVKIVLETRGTKQDEFISMNHFSKNNLEQYYEFIKMTGATHVVVGITYGYHLFLMLETTCESEKEKMKVQGKLELKLMSPVQGEVEGSYKTKEEKKLNELKVRVHGSVQIPSNPISFEEAIEIYKRIPEFVTNKESPMTVHLLPLASVCSSLPKACSQINEAVLNSVTAIFEDIRESEVALIEIQTSDIAIIEPRIRRKAKKLSAMLLEHKIWLQMKLYEIISNPKMVKDSSESEQVQNVLKKHQNSPFSTEIFGIYVLKMEKEGCFLKNLMRMLTFSDEVGSSGDAIDMNVGKGGRNRISIDILSDETDFLIPFERCKVFVLEIPIITVEDDLLKEMQKYDPENDNGWVASRKAESLTLPFEDKTIQRKVLKCAKDFVKLAQSHENDDEKSLTKFRCVFAGYEIDREPTINAYNASTGDIEPYYHKRLQTRSVFKGHKEDRKPAVRTCEATIADLQTMSDDKASKRVNTLVSFFERKS